MATAILTTNPRGSHLRLTNHGFQFASYPVPVQRGEEPTDAADRTLTEYGWATTSEWDTNDGQRWVAAIDMTAEA
ncbi:hypothetical protein AB0B94_30885 [Micromonospora sp. NPDC048986]|uniref:hypothetical protein n=1 Tax=Micromonospora sp. NPDC048986 TaxID=3155644 RepID=UPI0033CE3C07